MAPTGTTSKRDATVSLRILCMTSLFRYAGLPQTREIGGFGQGTDFGIVVPMRLFDACQVKIGLAQPLRLAELCPSAFGIAFERVTAREIGVDAWWGDIAKACATSRSARCRSSLGRSLRSSTTRATRAADSQAAASVACGSSANAVSNRFAASSYLSLEIGFVSTARPRRI